MKIDIETVREKIITGLPSNIRWYINGVQLDLDFTYSQYDLEPISDSVLNCKIEKEWEALYVFGGQDYAEGGGSSSAITVDYKTGNILGFDVERPSGDVIFFINTDIDKYIQSVRLFDHVLRTKQSSQKDLESKLKEIDSTGYSKGDWRLLAEYINEKPKST